MSEQNKKIGQEPAFAYQIALANGETVESIGISKRFYAACAAMQGLIASNQTMYKVNSPTNDIMDGFTEPISLCRDAFTFADELLKRENL